MTARKGIPQQPSKLEAIFKMILDDAGITDYRREYQFDAHRKWRIDFAWPDEDDMLAVEIEGYGHQKTNRYLSDMEKYNSLAEGGWTLLRFNKAMILNGMALRDTQRALRERRPDGTT